ncbi:MAG: MarR family transcriptional regulator [Propionibacteriaceae bacterium]|nr:MarR family transcriptional regulator [Propionibacteriaceae bacterium]
MGEDETPWLNQTEQGIWRDWLRATERIHSHLDAGLREFGLDLAEYEIFVTLSESPGRRMRMSELAGAARHSRSRLTHTISRMEKQGLVTRETCSADGRGVWATLTEGGYELLEQVAPHHVAAVRHIFVDAIDPEDFTALGRAMASVVAVAD